MEKTDGFPSGPRTTPFGSFFGVVSTAGDVAVSSLSLELLIPLCVCVLTAQKNRERMGVSWKVICMVQRPAEVLSLAELELEPPAKFVMWSWLLRLGYSPHRR